MILEPPARLWALRPPKVGGARCAIPFTAAALDSGRQVSCALSPAHLAARPLDKPPDRMPRVHDFLVPRRPRAAVVFFCGGRRPRPTGFACPCVQGYNIKRRARSGLFALAVSIAQANYRNLRECTYAITQNTAIIARGGLLVKAFCDKICENVLHFASGGLFSMRAGARALNSSQKRSFAKN